MSERYDIFISYRRDGGFATANHLYRLLTQDGYHVSFDIDSLREGDFNIAIYNRIEQCSDFLLIVDNHCFDKTLDTTFDSKYDWLRTELAYALKLKKNIIPILLNGVNGFPPNLPHDISGIKTKNGPEYNQSYFDEFYHKLKSFLHSNPSKPGAIARSRKYVHYLLMTIILISLLGLFLHYYGSMSHDVKTHEVKDSICVNPVMGQYEYSGSIDINGLPDGKGKAIFPQGDIYEGEFSHGVFEGKCTYYNAETGDRFDGTYKDNKRYEGTYVWKEGPYFTGYYKDNDLYKGTLYDVSGEIIREY